MEESFVLIDQTGSNDLVDIISQLSTWSKLTVSEFPVPKLTFFIHRATELKDLSVLLRKHTLLKISGTAKISSGFNLKCDF